MTKKTVSKPAAKSAPKKAAKAKTAAPAKAPAKKPLIPPPLTKPAAEAKTAAVAEAPKVIARVPAGLADKPRIRKGAVIREDGLETGGPDAILIDAVKKPGGALHSALCNAVGGWKKCDRRLARAAALVGLKLRATRLDGDIRFEVVR